MPSKPAKRRKTPLTGIKSAVAPTARELKTPTGSLAGQSHKVTQNVISRFHTLLKRKAQLEQSLKTSDSLSVRSELTAISQEIEDLGGLEAYQVASTLGQAEERGGDSSKVLVEWLLEMDAAPVSSGIPLKMLEIGALRPDNLAARQAWISNTPIDLNSRHPEIEAQDFLTRPRACSDEDRFDLISCSLVLNFVPSPNDRGERRARGECRRWATDPKSQAKCSDWRTTFFCLIDQPSSSSSCRYLASRTRAILLESISKKS